MSEEYLPSSYLEIDALLTDCRYVIGFKMSEIQNSNGLHVIKISNKNVMWCFTMKFWYQN